MAMVAIICTVLPTVPSGDEHVPRTVQKQTETHFVASDED
jgi:hypothetical protein